MDIYKFYIAKKVPVELFDFTLLSSKDIDKLLFLDHKHDKINMIKVDISNITVLKEIAANSYLTEKQYNFICSIEFYTDIKPFKLLICNKNLTFEQFKRLIMLGNNIRFVMANSLRLCLNNKKLDFLLDLIILELNKNKTDSFECFRNIYYNKLTLEQCRKLLNCFSIDDENHKQLFIRLLNNKLISNKIKKILMNDYDKKEIFK